MEYEEELRERARQARMKQWSFQRWSPSPALVSETEDGTVLEKFTGQQYNQEKSELIEDGWDHDHCMICWQSICDCGSERCLPEGYTDGDDWLCPSCYTTVIEKGEDPEVKLDEI